MNIDILGINELKWTRMGNLVQMTITSTTDGQESLRRNGVAVIGNKSPKYNLKSDRMISIPFQCKPFSTIIIQVYAPTTNAETAEVEWFYEDRQDLDLKKDVLFIIGDWNAKVRKSDT